MIKPGAKVDTLSVSAMIASNAIPLYGVIAEGWDGLVIIVLYLLETIIIGAFHAMRLFSFGTFIGFKGGRTPRSAIFFMAFFLFHYFMFVFVQSVLFFGFLRDEIPEIKDGFNVFYNFGLFLKEPYIIAVYGFIINQMVFTGRELFKTRSFSALTPGEYMFLPYSRIFVQQFVVIFGAMVFLIFNSVTALVILFIILKTAGEYLGQKYGDTWIKPHVKKA